MYRAWVCVKFVSIDEGVINYNIIIKQVEFKNILDVWDQLKLKNFDNVVDFKITTDYPKDI